MRQQKNFCTIVFDYKSPPDNLAIISSLYRLSRPTTNYLPRAGNKWIDLIKFVLVHTRSPTRSAARPPARPLDLLGYTHGNRLKVVHDGNKLVG